MSATEAIWCGGAFSAAGACPQIFSLLDVSEHATAAEIRRAFRAEWSRISAAVPRTSAENRLLGEKKAVLSESFARWERGEIIPLPSEEKKLVTAFTFTGVLWGIAHGIGWLVSKMNHNCFCCCVPDEMDECYGSCCYLEGLPWCRTPFLILDIAVTLMTIFCVIMDLINGNFILFRPFKAMRNARQRRRIERIRVQERERIERNELQYQEDAEKLYKQYVKLSSFEPERLRVLNTLARIPTEFPQADRDFRHMMNELNGPDGPVRRWQILYREFDANRQELLRLGQETKKYVDIETNRSANDETAQKVRTFMRLNWNER